MKKVRYTKIVVMVALLSTLLGLTGNVALAGGNPPIKGAVTQGSSPPVK